MAVRCYCIKCTLPGMRNTSLIDAHCHLDFDVFNHDREQVLSRSDAQNISDIIIPGTQKKYWSRINKLCADDERLHPCYGLHPYWTGEHEQHDIDALAEYVSVNKAVAIGECGLDLRSNQADEKTQQYFFEAQLRLAVDSNLPVVIHSVKATDKVIDTIKRFNDIKGMVHSFSGSSEQARRLIDHGFFISISGSVTMENAKKIRETARTIPLTALLIETDAPDQAGSDHRGERNEPAFLVDTLHTIAGLRDIAAEDIAEQTTANTRKLFAL